MSNSNTVRAKMRCNYVGQPNYGHVTVKLNAVYSDDPNSENKVFTDATPAASIDLVIQETKPAAKMFEIGKEYYVDFIETAVA